MANETRKIRFLASQGNPTGGPIIRRGTVTDFPAFWADRFIADGTAELVGNTDAPPPSQDKKNGKRKGKG